MGEIRVIRVHGIPIFGQPHAGTMAPSASRPVQRDQGLPISRTSLSAPSVIEK